MVHSVYSCCQCGIEKNKKVHFWRHLLTSVCKEINFKLSSNLLLEGKDCINEMIHTNCATFFITEWNYIIKYKEVEWANWFCQWFYWAYLSIDKMASFWHVRCKSIKMTFRCDCQTPVSYTHLTLPTIYSV